MITDTQIDRIGRKRPELYAKTQEAANLVINHGVDEKTALTLIKGEPPTDSTLSRFKDKVQKYRLANPGMVKLAHQAVKDTLKMKPITYEASKPVPGVGIVDYTETIMPSITNRLAAAAMVLDRDQPVKHVNVNLNASITPVDLADFGA